MPVVLNEADLAVLEVLSAAAERNAPCPTNLMIGEKAAVTHGKVKGALVRLEAHGRIEIRSARWSRAIYIPETGKMTDWTHQPVKSIRDAGKLLKSADIRRLKIVEILQKAADDGLPMPTNFDIGQALTCADETIARDLRALARLGMVVVESPGGGNRRATIIETGATTAWAGHTRKHARRVFKDRPANDDEVESAPAGPSSLAPCARVGCKDTVVRGKAYCAEHEVSEVLAWPVVPQELEDMAA